MLDFHLHVWPHEPGTPAPTIDQLERYCEVAASRGVEQIAITEHCHRFTRIADEVIPHWSRPTEGPMADATRHVLEVEGGADLDRYVSALVTAQDRGLPILVGMEVDHLPGADEAMAAVLGEYPFDVLLGSVHWLDDWLFDDYGTPVFAQQWEERDTGEVWRRYIDAIGELADSGMVDVLAHLDVVKVTGHRPVDLEAHEDRLADVVASSGVAVEVSSAGLRKPCAEIYPSPRLLGLLADRGVGFTLASDAHQVDRVAEAHDTLTAALDTAGVTELTTFDRRRPAPLPRPTQG